MAIPANVTVPVISGSRVHNDIVHLCGITPDPVGDIGVQTAQTLERIDALLASEGTDKSQLLTAQVWLADMRDFSAHNDAWNAWVDPTSAPVRACVEAKLWLQGILVEIMVTAVKP